MRLDAMAWARGRAASVGLRSSLQLALSSAGAAVAIGDANVAARRVQARQGAALLALAQHSESALRQINALTAFGSVVPDCLTRHRLAAALARWRGERKVLAGPLRRISVTCELPQGNSWPRRLNCPFSPVWLPFLGRG